MKKYLLLDCDGNDFIEDYIAIGLDGVKSGIVQILEMYIEEINDYEEYLSVNLSIDIIKSLKSIKSIKEHLRMFYDIDIRELKEEGEEMKKEMYKEMADDILDDVIRVTYEDESKDNEIYLNSYVWDVCRSRYNQLTDEEVDIVCNIVSMWYEDLKNEKILREIEIC